MKGNLQLLIFISLFSTSLMAQFTQQGNKLVGTGNIGNANQGYAVAISADGNTALVGGYGDNGTAGAVWVYTRSGSTWTQQGSKLVATDGGSNSTFGCSVALSDDGNTALIGGYGDNNTIGAAWVFTRSGSTWTQQGSKLVGTGYVGTPYQGVSVALSADGNTALIGGRNDNNSQGAVWVFTRSGSTWTQQGSKLVGTGNTGTANKGISVALSADGNTALVGGYNDNNNIGAAWVFTRSGSTWTQEGSKLVGSGNVGVAFQGYSVSLSNDGNTALVGAWADDTDRGATWVFTRSGSTWTQQGSKLVGIGVTANAKQGIGVSLSGNGNTAVIGAWGHSSNTGGMVVFNRSGTTWTQQGSGITGSDPVSASAQGFAIAISDDGSTAIMGGFGDNSNQGAAWVFYNSAALSIELVEFIGKNTERGNLLSWQTANETNNKGFEVERQRGENWETLGFVASKSSKGTSHSYQFTDNAPLSMSYYRLRQIDHDGKETLSKVVSVANKGTNAFKVYPSVTSHYLHIDTESSTSYQIVNLLGQVVLSGQVAARIDVSALVQGTYIFKSGEVQVKFVKQ